MITATIKKWGNGMGLRLPANILKSLNMTDGTKIKIEIEDEKIILTKAKYNLDELLSQITEENKHDFIDLGEPVGKEIW